MPRRAGPLLGSTQSHKLMQIALGAELHDTSPLFDASSRQQRLEARLAPLAATKPTLQAAYRKSHAKAGLRGCASSP